MKEIKNMAKAKVKSKIEKAERKAARKAKAARKSIAALASVLIAAAALVGCQSVPSRSQTLTFDHCQITFNGAGDGSAVPSAEIGTQAMAIENSGTENQSPTQTTDVKPDVDVSVGTAKGGGILETAAARLLDGGASGSAQGEDKSAAGCTGGSCTE